jgi:hypothetical protein
LLWRLRASKIHMRQQAAAAALIALAWIQVCPALLLAKPTRTIAGLGARKLIVSPPTPRASRQRIAATSTRHSFAAAHAGIVPTRQPAPQSDRVHTSKRLPARGRTPLQQRAQSARGLRSENTLDSKIDRQRHAGHAAPSTPHYAFTPDTGPSRLLSDGTATTDESAAPTALSSPDAAPDSPTLLTNPGIPHPASASQPLKSIAEEASTPVLLPPLRVASLYDSFGRLIVPPPLYGSREILLRQNQMADRDGLDRVRDSADLLDLRRAKKLVALPDNQTLRVDYRLPQDRRFSRPWTAAFLTVLAADYYASFHSPLQVDSAVRTVAFQRRLIRTNGNAAPSTGDTASPHLTGQAVDIAKGGLSRLQIAWMRTYLQPLIDLGKIDVEEEFQQSCFHISVYRNYLPIAPARISVAARQLPPESRISMGLQPPE